MARKQINVFHKKSKYSFNLRGLATSDGWMADILSIVHKQRNAHNVSLLFGILFLHFFLTCQAFSWIAKNPFSPTIPNTTYSKSNTAIMEVDINIHLLLLYVAAVGFFILYKNGLNWHSCINLILFMLCPSKILDVLEKLWLSSSRRLLSTHIVDR